MKMLKSLIAGLRPPEAKPAAGVEYPLDLEAKHAALHSRADVRRHLDALHGDFRIGAERYTDLFYRCLDQTGTQLTPFTVFQRFGTREDLVRYFLATLNVPGARAECGAYRGATALLLCHAWRSRDPAFGGEGFHVIDSFSGTSAPGDADLIPVRDPDGATRMSHFFPTGKTDVTADLVRGHFGDFPGVAIHEGWIPQVFEGLPETQWAFVHLDVTLYAPTLAALRFFYPRLASGGALICTGSVFCPGVQQAVDEFSGQADAAYVLLGYGQRVFLKR